MIEITLGRGNRIKVHTPEGDLDIDVSRTDSMLPEQTLIKISTNYGRRKLQVQEVAVDQLGQARELIIRDA